MFLLLLLLLKASPMTALLLSSLVGMGLPVAVTAIAGTVGVTAAEVRAGLTIFKLLRAGSKYFPHEKATPENSYVTRVKQSGDDRWIRNHEEWF